MEWLGDVGGLFDGLHLLVGPFMAPISAYALKLLLLASAYRDSSQSATSSTQRFSSISYVSKESDVRKAGNNDSQGSLPRRWLRHRALITKAETECVNKLDLVKFYTTQRFSVLTSLASLNADQRQRLQKLSSMNRDELMKSDKGNEESDQSTAPSVKA